MSRDISAYSSMLLVSCLSLAFLFATTMAQNGPLLPTDRLYNVFDDPSNLPSSTMIQAAPNGTSIITPQFLITYNAWLYSVWFLCQGGASPCTYTLSTVDLSNAQYQIRDTLSGTVVCPGVLGIVHIVPTIRLQAVIGDSLAVSVHGPGTCQLGVANHQTGFDSLSSSDVFVPGAYVTFNSTEQILGQGVKLIIGATLLIHAGFYQDPQFLGLQGQSFQVHGIPNSVFNLISSPYFQLNSRFTYLSTGACNYNNTPCWSHPGTYLDQLGFNFGRTSTQLKVLSGSNAEGMRVYLGGVEVVSGQAAVTIPAFTVPFLDNYNSTYDVLSRKPTPSTVLIDFVSKDQILIESADWVFRVTNSDSFFNMDVKFLQTDVLALGGQTKLTLNSNTDDTAVFPRIPLHGFVGQTWKNVEYKDKRFYEGEALDYELSSENLFGNDFLYNQFILSN